MSPRASTSELVDETPARALAIYAHPDDAEVSCGGSLARWAARGCDVHLLVCTTGDKGTTDPSADVERLVVDRSREVDDAAAVLGVAAVHRLGRTDGELDNDRSLREALVRLIRTVRPEVVICPDPTAVIFGEHYFNHRDHRELGLAALDAVSPASSSPGYFREAGPPWSVGAVYLSASLEPNVLIDISPVIDRKAEAILCHRSQIGESGEWLGTATRERAQAAGRSAGVGYAEAFRRLRLSP